MAGLIVLMGPTGAGKSVQAQRLVELRGDVHISSGELLRRDPAEAALLASGQLAPSAAVERLVAAAIAGVPEATTILLDGFPRALDEAVWLDAQLPGWRRKLRAVVLFEVDYHVSARRLAERQRADDTPAALEAKWAEYERMTRPVLHHYRTLGLLMTVDGNASIEAVNKEFMRLLP